MNTKIITEIIENLIVDFDENQLQIIERTLYRILKDKEIIEACIFREHRPGFPSELIRYSA